MGGAYCRGAAVCSGAGRGRLRSWPRLSVAAVGVAVGEAVGDGSAGIGGGLLGSCVVGAVVAAAIVEASWKLAADPLLVPKYTSAAVATPQPIRMILPLPTQ